MEAWLSGLKQHPAKMLGEQSSRRFESFRLRQFSPSVSEGRKLSVPQYCGTPTKALVVQWIGRELAELEIGVRLLSGAQKVQRKQV